MAKNVAYSSLIKQLQYDLRLQLVSRFPENNGQNRAAGNLYAHG